MILKLLKNQYFWLLLVLFFGLLVRLYKIDSPIADWHSWRQADTAEVTRNFIKEGLNPFIPKYDDVSGVAENPTPNLGRFRFVEFPLYNIFVYPLYLIFGMDEKYHRLITILSSLGSCAFLYFIVRKYADKLTAFFASFTFAFMPFNVFFSRTTLPDPFFLMFALGMILFLSNWIEQKNKIDAILGFSFTALAFLIKPWAIFFFLPLLYLLSLNGRKRFNLKFVVLTLTALLPFLAWRLWILNHPEGIPASNWLLNGDGIRFRPAFFWWIISERLGQEILTAAGVGLFLIGIISRLKQKNYFLHLWALSSFLFIMIFATGNVRHNYYQILFIPVASIFISLGFVKLLKGDSMFLPRIWTIPIGLLLFSLTFYFGWKQVSGFYQINNPSIVDAGKAADRLLPEDAKVLAPYNGDTAFLYQTNRSGWAFIPYSIKDMIADYGVTAYVSTTNDKKTAWVQRHFKVLEKNPNFVIADLTHLSNKFDDHLDPEPK